MLRHEMHATVDVKKQIYYAVQVFVQHEIQGWVSDLGAIYLIDCSSR